MIADTLGVKGVEHRDGVRLLVDTIIAPPQGASSEAITAGNRPPEQAYNNTLVAAFDQAKAKAAALAARAGATLGPALSIQEGTELVPEAPTQTAARGPRGTAAPSPPTKPGASTVTATVRVVFALL